MNKKRISHIFLALVMLVVFSNSKIFAQNIAINSTGAASVASAMLDITSTTSGLLVPRMTAAQRAAIAAPATSLLVYQTDAGTMGIGFYFYNGAAWVPFGTNNGGWGLLGNTGTVSGTNFIGTTDAIDFTVRTTNIERMRVLAGGNVGVGTTVPRSQMHIDGAAAATAFRITNSTTANAAATDGFKMEIPAASSSVVLSNQENANIQFNTNNAFRTVIFNDGTYWHGGSAATAFDAAEIDAPAGMLAGVGPIWGVSAGPAANGGGYGAAATNYGILGMVVGTRDYSMAVQGQVGTGNRSAAIFGLAGNSVPWGALGYRQSGAGTYWGGYFTTTTTGAGFSPTNATSGMGVGIYSDFTGSIVRGEVIGQVTIGELFAAYNIGNEFTAGYKADVVTNGDVKTVAFSNTSTELKVYADGSSQLVNGSVFVSFDESFKKLSSQTLPTVTVSPMGECKGLYVSSVETNGFWVKELNSGASNVSISWIAIAKRVDNVAEIPSDILNKDFETNIKKVVINENNPENSASSMWWNGNKIVFDQPAPDVKPIGKAKTLSDKTNRMNPR